MARNRAMAGAGAKRMGGAGIKPAMPKTAMAGKPAGGPPPAMGAGPPHMAPPAPKPPMGAPVGAPPPMPGGGLGPPGGGGGMGGSGGFAAGGPIPEAAEPIGEASKFARGGSVGGGDAKSRVGRDTGKGSKSS